MRAGAQIFMSYPAILTAVIIIIACNAKEEKHEKGKTEQKKADTVQADNKKPEPPAEKTYSNERFRNVTIEKIADNKYRLKGQAQIFEASFSWVIEDGHNEIKSGYHMTDAGAPEWGNFEFTVELDKKNPGLTYHIILFEVSAKDGRREFELPILLS